jgi:glycosyltransferase involved in cell wall biosynthesis
MPYRIALLSKYPPLEGGIAAKTYWLARGLAKRGHSIHVVTHGVSAGQEYQIQGAESPPDTIPNLSIHRPPDEIPWHIPEDKEYALTLLDTILSVIREHKIQILDSGYLVPYGIEGHLAKLITGVRHIVRHGGSDLEKFLKKRVLGSLLDDTIASADTVITERSRKQILGSIASRLAYQPAYVPDESVFRPHVTQQPRWRLATIGKINYHWEHRALDSIVDIMMQLVPQFECLIIGQGKGFTDFRQNLSSKLTSNLNWSPFVPPWEMPRLLNQLDAIFVFELKLPHPVVSNLVLEATSSGVGIITDRPDFAETYRDVVNLNKNQVLVVAPTDSLSSAEMIAKWVQERASAELNSGQLLSFQDYLASTERIYADALAANRDPN